MKTKPNSTASQFYSKYKWHLFIGVFIASFSLYFNTLNHSFTLDDPLVIVKNNHVQKGIGGIRDILSNSYLHGFDGTNKNTYRPISLVSFALENHFFGTSSFAYHLLNVLFYALLCIVVARLLFLIFPQEPTLLILSIIALFVTHPIHTEVVANIKSRDEIYAMLFGIMSLIFLLKYESSKKSMLYISSIFFLLSIFSKENTVTLIAIFPLTLYFFRNYAISKAVSTCLIYLFPVMLLFAFRIVILDDLLQTTSATANWETAFNNTLFAADNYLEELATNSYIFLKYMQLVIVPFTLVSDYSIGTFEIVNFTNLRAICGLLVLVGLFIMALFKFKTRSSVSYAILFFLITFSITSNFIFKIGSTLGERFLFLPSFGSVILLTFVLFKILRSQRNLFLLSIFSIVLFYSWRTLDRNNDWENNYILFSEDIKTNTKSARLMSNFAQEKHKRDINIKNKNQRLLEANKTASYYKQALKHHPNKDFINSKLGYLYFAIEDYSMAAEHFEKALPAQNVIEHKIYYQLGLCYENLNRYPKAIGSYEKAIEKESSNEQYWRHLGYVCFSNKDYHKAIKAFKKCIDLKVEDSTSELLNIAISYHALRDYTNAKKYYKEVLLIDPNNSQAKKNLATI